MPVAESEGSRRGQKYSAAGGKSLDNLGEKRLNMVTDQGASTSGTWQMVDVTRPLNSVRQVCKQGNRVVFGYNGGIIYNIQTGEEIPFGVEGDVYTWDFWLPPESGMSSAASQADPGQSGPVFARPGWKR